MCAACLGCRRLMCVGASFGSGCWGVRTPPSQWGALRQGLVVLPRTLRSYLRICMAVLARWVEGCGVMCGVSGVSPTDVCGGRVLAQGVWCRYHHPVGGVPRARA